MSKVFVNIGLSLDGYMAPEGNFRENLKLGPGGETGAVNDRLRHTTEHDRRQHHGQANVRARRAKLARGSSVSHARVGAALFSWLSWFRGLISSWSVLQGSPLLHGGECCSRASRMLQVATVDVSAASSS